MADQAALLNNLLNQTHAGPVFGEGVAFGPLGDEQRRRIAEQTVAIMFETSGSLLGNVPAALQDIPEQAFRGIGEVTPKASAFVGALAAGDLHSKEGVHPLSLATRSVCAMYICDQLIDRGDKPMRRAVLRHTAGTHSSGLRWRGLVADRRKIITYMEDSLRELGGEEQAPDIISCFSNLVLRNEAELQALSNEYRRRPARRREAFLHTQASHIANGLVDEAGFQTVTASLHAAYYRFDPSLPTIAELHSNPHIARTIQVCNAVARVADERGDRVMDSGLRPEYGVFSINLFNQCHPVMVERVCRLAGIEDAGEIAALQSHFTAVKNADPEDAATQDHHSAQITNTFFRRMRNEVNGLESRLPPETYERFKTYITLCKRVGEICHVNMMGDIAMAGGDQ